MPYAIVAKSVAIAGLYKLSHGEASLVSEAIDRLRHDPVPSDAEPIEYTVTMYRIRVLARVVEYQVDHSQRVINLLNIV
jgi:mRNA-degrading endonuclease RelE of RelBE toxin-antitoxin system